MVTLDLLTPKWRATISMTSLLALPFSGGLATYMRNEPSFALSIPGRDERVTTRARINRPFSCLSRPSTPANYAAPKRNRAGGPPGDISSVDSMQMSGSLPEEVLLALFAPAAPLLDFGLFGVIWICVVCKGVFLVAELQDLVYQL